MPARYSIRNWHTDEELGEYVANTEAEALDAMARAYGFDNYDAVLAGYGVSRAEAIAELEITVLQNGGST